MSSNESQETSILNALVEGLEDRHRSRQFLKYVMDISPVNLWRLILPIARFLIGKEYDIDAEELRDFCQKRLEIIEVLRLYPRGYIDAEVEYMVGMAEHFIDISLPGFFYEPCVSFWSNKF